MSRQARSRRLPVGAEVDPDGGVHFRVWAPDCTRVEVIAGRTSEALSPEDDGYFSGRVPSAETGTRYRYRLDGRGPFPDPASRFQPDGPHGPSEVVDASAFAWSDSAWRGVELAGQVLY
ncbi:MAG TPA: malto-oligosyltrehalose trehalohydrolase, partial [Usitatibacter sp.]|nr:malto-oligosyltrehalose trehalohydrolase [Usitatibacter sp.]